MLDTQPIYQEVYAMAKTGPHTLAQLLNAVRSSSPGADAEHAQDVFFKALLGSTVYAHVPMEGPPEGVMRFLQFVRPDNGQTVLSFFSERAQAEAAADDPALERRDATRSESPRRTHPSVPCDASILACADSAA